MNRCLSERRIRDNRIRRRRELRRHILTGLATAMLVITFSLCFFSFKIKAQSNENFPYKYYKSIRVEEGDSLWGYAREYGDSRYYDSNRDYIKEVISVNTLPDDRITAGQYLILPYYDTTFVE